MDHILKVANLTKTFTNAGRELTVLDDISFELVPGATISIVGPSGSGKTTLLGLCAGLDRATSGTVALAGHQLDELSEDERALARNESVGFIFQNFQLIPTLTAIENVMVPLELKGSKKAYDKAKDLLDRVGLGERLNHYPAQLSGGEQQRVSLARAFANEPQILFADEPTGNLDDATGQKVEDLLFQLNRDAGTALVLVTHDKELAAKAQRMIQLKGGRVESDELLTAKTAQ